MAKPRKVGRPRKEGDQLLNVPLRIMLTAEQRQLIQKAADLDYMDVSGWARSLLLQAAKERCQRDTRRER